LSSSTTIETKSDIRQLSLEKLTEVFLEMGEKSFRAKQVYQWLWQKGAHSFEEMTNLSLSLREKLESRFEIRAIVFDEVQRSADGTIKSRFLLHDGFAVEGVLIPADERLTACVSSQVGCSLTCKFCATGKMKRERNLTPDEIFDQVMLINRQALEHYGRPLSNIVYMGMGEPLLNYKNVMESVKLISSPDGLHISPRRITLSTAGIAKMIMKLADDGTKVKLALSLHAANDTKRNQIMPINESNSLEALKEALRYYYEKMGKRVCYEYIMFNNFNESMQDAKELAAFCKTIPCKVNMIEYNPIDGAEFQRAREDRLLAFQEAVAAKGITITLRRSRGKDIDAACGQLANKS